jgi:hypothetical protein
MPNLFLLLSNHAVLIAQSTKLVRLAQPGLLISKWSSSAIPRCNLFHEASVPDRESWVIITPKNDLLMGGRLLFRGSAERYEEGI